jgi:predicted sulfurtransferase
MDRSVNSTQVLSILNIAFYKFVQLTDLQEVRQELKRICLHWDLKGTILVSSEGINGTLAAEVSRIRKFQEDLHRIPDFSDLVFKESYSAVVPFQRMFVKLKKEIIPLGDPGIMPAQYTGPRIQPQELKKWLDDGRDVILLDTRNDYEIEHGTFEKAVHLGIGHFRNFPDRLKCLPEDQRKRPVVMFCTGGIRCEKASVAALRAGFEDVYQLDGGILKYFEECGSSHYRGNCFVFDERVAIDPNLKPIL